MATTNNKLEQLKSQARELTENELDQATGGCTDGPETIRMKLEEGK